MTIKNLPLKPMATITRLGMKPANMDDLIYEHLKSNINKPLPVEHISYFQDQRLCHITLALPELERIVKFDDNTEHVLFETTLIFSTDDVDITLSYGLDAALTTISTDVEWSEYQKAIANAIKIIEDKYMIDKEYLEQDYNEMIVQTLQVLRGVRDE